MAAVRRLFAQGNSVVVVISADNLAHLGCSKGDELEFFKEDRKRLTLRKFRAATTPVRTRRSSTKRGWGAGRSGG